MTYKASIIIPCYNKERYIRRALDSVVAQSRFEEFEVIVVDDCSTDSSADIVAEYAERYENVSLLRFEQGSGGASKPRNAAIEKSTADYLIFMDPDDEVVNDGYSTLLTKMEEYESDILIAARACVSTAGVLEFVDYIDEDFTFVNESSYEIKLDLLGRRPFILKTIYRKSLIADNGIRFNEKIRTSEDEAFDMRCVAYANKVTKINDIVYRYTVESENSITTGVSMRIYQEIDDVFAELYDTYSLVFSDEVIARRFMVLTCSFYLYRLTFLSSVEEISQACEYVYDAFDRLGYELFDTLEDPVQIEVLSEIRARDVSRYIQQRFLTRIRSLNARNGRNQDELKKTKRSLKKTKRALRAAREELQEAQGQLAQAQANGRVQVRENKSPSHATGLGKLFGRKG